MHIILGGAFNGKRQYVKESFKEVPLTFFEGELPDKTLLQLGQSIAIGRFEEMLGGYDHLSEDTVVELLLKNILALDKDYNVICICTDMSRGIVPLEKELRRQRDICGRLYQYLCKDADSVTRIWYGLAQTLKEATP